MTMRTHPDSLSPIVRENAWMLNSYAKGVG